MGDLSLLEFVELPPSVSNTLLDGKALGGSDIARLPSTAIPTGFAPDGVPVGGQIVGPWLEDPTPLKLAELIEREFGGLVPPKMFDD